MIILPILMTSGMCFCFTTAQRLVHLFKMTNHKEAILLGSVAGDAFELAFHVTVASMEKELKVVLKHVATLVAFPDSVAMLRIQVPSQLFSKVVRVKVY